jgi:hypothetical protein
LHRPAEVVSATARLHRNDTWGKLCGQVDESVSLNPPTNDNPPAGVLTCNAAGVLSEIYPYTLTDIDPLLC